MTNESIKQFWENQTSSFSRYDSPEYYARKSKEHASLMTNEELIGPCIDLGCGAGELLQFLLLHMNVVRGLDYSETMLEAARKRLEDSSIKLVCASLADTLPLAEEKTWMTTGGLNQYLDQGQMRDFLRMFKLNESAHSLFLFDCIDPLRYSLFPFGMSYISKAKCASKGFNGWLRAAAFSSRRALVGAKLALGILLDPSGKLDRPSMGYAYTPLQWRSFLEPLDLEVEFVSSQSFEYRFHAIIRK